jgi:hypothetical protein
MIDFLLAVSGVTDCDSQIKQPQRLIRKHDNVKGSSPEDSVVPSQHRLQFLSNLVAKFRFVGARFHLNIVV